MSESRRELEALIIQAVGEIDRGLDIADREARAGRLADTRATIRDVRTCVRLLDEAIPALCNATRPGGDR